MLAFAGTQLRPGLTTDALDAIVHDRIVALDLYPSPLGYRGFPKSICTSVNNVACHGIPDTRALVDGDIINIDVSTYHRNGFHGDCSQTFLVGNVDAKGRTLVAVTNECLERAIRICGPNQRFSAIGDIIETHASSQGFTVCPRFIGHGIGRDFHTAPEILHFRNDQPGFMQAGMIFTIEPILNQGDEDVREWSDGWTAVTTDYGRSAQCEHTILITDEVCLPCLFICLYSYERHRAARC